MRNTAKTAGKITTAYSYIRWSSEKQTGNDSLRRQTELTDDACKTNGWTLDKSTWLDSATSAYHGNNSKLGGALSAFLEAIQSGRIPNDGSAVLCCEAIDRLSRQEVLTALSQFISIIKAGVAIYTCQDGKLFSEEIVNENPMELMFSIMLMMKAHLESKHKGQRVSAKWQQRQKNADKTAMSKNTYCWLKVVDGKYQPIPENVKLIRRIIQMATNGTGCPSIARILNKEGVKPLGVSAKLWQQGRINCILKNRALLGFYQPHQISGNKRISTGEELKVYPAIITEAEWQALQHGIHCRRGTFKGRSGEKGSNLFGTLLSDGADGSFMLNQRTNNSPYLVNSTAIKGNSDYQVFPYELFENNFLSFIKELDTAAILGVKEDNHSEAMAEAQATLAKLTGKMASLQALMAADGDLEALVPVLKSVQAQIKVAQKTIAECKQHKAGSEQYAVTDLVSLIEAINCKDDEKRISYRFKLRMALATLISKISLTIKKDKLEGKCWKVAFVEVNFHSGTKRAFILSYPFGKPELAVSLVAPDYK